MPNARATLKAIARQAMVERGFEPDYSQAAVAQVTQLPEPASLKGGRPFDVAQGRRDLRHLLWCSIDNDDSRDLDQLSVAVERGGRTAILVAIADVDAMVPCDSPVDRYAQTHIGLHTGRSVSDAARAAVHRSHLAQRRRRPSCSGGGDDDR
jgi:exoribonuclease-2